MKLENFSYRVVGLLLELSICVIYINGLTHVHLCHYTCDLILKALGNIHISKNVIFFLSYSHRLPNKVGDFIKTLIFSKRLFILFCSINKSSNAMLYVSQKLLTVFKISAKCPDWCHLISEICVQ